VTSRGTLGNWVAVGVSLLLIVAVLVAIGLHVGGGVPWANVVIPLVMFVGLQMVIFIAMFWAGKRARSRNDFSVAIVLAGLYCWSTGLLMIHYGTKWGFLSQLDIHGNRVGFSIFIGIATVLTFTLFSFKK